MRQFAADASHELRTPLARPDRGSSLDLTETDLSELARDAVADARAVEPDRPVATDVPPATARQFTFTFLPNGSEVPLPPPGFHPACFRVRSTSILPTIA